MQGCLQFLDQSLTRVKQIDVSLGLVGFETLEQQVPVQFNKIYRNRSNYPNGQK